MAKYQFPLTELVEMEAEALDLDTDLDYSRYPSSLEEVASDFDNAITDALLEWDEDAPVLDEASTPLDVYLTITGSGAGIWDGRWDEFYTESELKELTAHLKKRLSKWADDTGGGRFNEALMDAAYQVQEEAEEED